MTVETKLTLLTARNVSTRFRPSIVSGWLRSIRMFFATDSVVGHYRAHNAATVGTGSGYNGEILRIWLEHLHMESTVDMS